MKDTPMPAFATLLPKIARDMLINAARVKDHKQRCFAVDAAIDQVKLYYPEFFRPTQPEKE